ncbi:MAG: pilus assembly protein PilP [Myxococcota bacterium]|nr:pilus assembly protein PilP [Myxococcota bacterium]
MRKNVSCSRLLLILFAVFVFLLGTCGEGADSSSDESPTKKSAPGARAPKNKKEAPLSPEKEGETSKKSTVVAQLKETDFIKGPRRRDPFEPFIELLTEQKDVQRQIQREVKLKEYDISDLKLIGIITKIGDPRAMVVVPDGTGFVLKRGDYVGKADFVNQGSRGEQIQVNWRVARIHGSGKEEERGVYLIREDPTAAKGVDITRFLPLHPNM